MTPSTSTPEASLPPGFRFHPTDEELILHYLRNKTASLPCPVSIIADVDIYKLDPWDLPAKAWFGEKEWYFFSPRDRKYPNGARPNRAAASGYWKATGTDKPIMATHGNNSSECIGVKKALVFYRGRPPKGLKTNWIMHEYRVAETTQRPIRLRETSMRLDDWVLCRIYKKSIPPPTISSEAENEDLWMEDGPIQVRHDLISQNTLNPSCLNVPVEGSVPSYAILGNSSTFTTTTPTPHVCGNSSGTMAIEGNYSTHWLPKPYPFTLGQCELKREREMTSESFVDDLAHPSKKFNDMCISTNFLAQSDAQHETIMDQQFYNQQLSLNSLLELH